MGQAKADSSKNAHLSDVCIGTSAAPTYLPAHFFETKYENGNTRSFNLIDGGVAANNPVCYSLQVEKTVCLLSFGRGKSVYDLV